MITAGDSKVNFFFPVESTRCFSPGISDQHKTNSILCVCVGGAFVSFCFVLAVLFFVLIFFILRVKERAREREKDRWRKTERKSERLGREVGGLGKVGRWGP